MYCLLDFVELYFCIFLAHWAFIKQLLDKWQISISLRSVTGKLMCTFSVSCSLEFSCFLKSCIVFFTLKTESPPPVFIDWCQEGNIFHEPCWGFWSEVKSLSRVWLFATPWTVAYQAPPSMGFSRQQYWSGLPFPSPGDLPNPGIEPGCPAF